MREGRRARTLRERRPVDPQDHERALEAVPDGVWLLDLDGRVDYANPRARGLLGPVAAQAAWPDLWPSDNQKAADRAIYVARQGQSGRFRSFLPVAGQRHIYLDTEVRLLTDAADRPDRLLAIARDVTQAVEEAAFLRSVVQLLPLSLTVRDAASGRFVLFNRSAEDLHEVNAEDVLGRTAEEAFPGGLGPGLTCEGLEPGAAPRICEETFATEAGVRHFATRRAYTFDDAGPRHLMSLTEDVTERRAASDAVSDALRRAEMANRAKNAFLANMSHELRTPLNGVVAAAEILAHYDLPPRQRTLVELIRGSGEALHRLVSDILDITRIEAGAVELDASPFHIGELVRELAAVFSLEAEPRGLLFSVTIAPQADVVLIGDRLRVRQVIANLLSNAVKFTERGAVGVALEPCRKWGVRLTVTDTGVGFDAAQRAAIFDRFRQNDESHTRRFGGAGLGLTICRELCQMMGARLDCESEPGRGSRFWLDLGLPRA